MSHTEKVIALLGGLRDRNNAHREKMDAAERCPTGDDWNELNPDVEMVASQAIGLLLDNRIETGLIARLEQALPYLEHPWVRELPFAKPSSVMAEQIREVLSQAKGGA